MKQDTPQSVAIEEQPLEEIEEIPIEPRPRPAGRRRPPGVPRRRRPEGDQQPRRPAGPAGPRARGNDEQERESPVKTTER